MKKLIAFCAASIAAVCAIAGGLNTYDGIVYTNLFEPAYITAPAAVTSTARNVSALKGNGTVILTASPGSSNIVTYGVSVQVQDSETGTTAWSNVSSVVATGYTNVGTITKIKLDLATVRKYLRVVATSTGDTAVASAVLCGYQ